MKIFRECKMGFEFYVRDYEGNDKLVKAYIPSAKVEFETEPYSDNYGNFIKNIDIKEWDKIEIHYAEEEH